VPETRDLGVAVNLVCRQFCSFSEIRNGSFRSMMHVRFGIRRIIMRLKNAEAWPAIVPGDPGVLRVRLAAAGRCALTHTYVGRNVTADFSTSAARARCAKDRDS
jgi:hypothetical protein